LIIHVGLEVKKLILKINRLTSSPFFVIAYGKYFVCAYDERCGFDMNGFVFACSKYRICGYGERWGFGF
jgi:hypothetical protein